jgi:hypothetical protein
VQNYNATSRTVAQLQNDLKPALRPSETSVQAQARVNAAKAELLNRGVVIPNRVSAPGNRPDLLKAYDTDASVPSRYSSDPRFKSLASDPDQGGAIKPSTRAEAMAGLGAESQGLIKAPISRGPRGIEFFDGDGHPWDVKTPPSPKPGQGWAFRVQDTGKAILSELRSKAQELPDGSRTPPGTFTNGKTGIPEPRRVILDCSLLNKADFLSLKQWLAQNLTREELSRILEINIHP